jgi:hypothetical protein
MWEQLEEEKSQYYNDIAEEHSQYRSPLLDDSDDFYDFSKIDDLLPSSPPLLTLVIVQTNRLKLPKLKGPKAFEALQSRQREATPSTPSEPTLL